MGEAVEQYAEAIVCPTSETLGELGGESSKILSRAKEVLDEKRKDYIDQHGRLPEGKAAIFKAENLNSNYAILASVPKYEEKNKYHRRSKVLLHRLCKDILEKVVMKDLDSVVIPNLAISEYNFPVEKYAKILGSVIREFIDENQKDMKEKQIILCCQDKAARKVIKKYMAKLLSETEYKPASPNRSSEDEAEERKAFYAEEVQREKERVMGKKQKPKEEKKRKSKSKNRNELSSSGKSDTDSFKTANGEADEEITENTEEQLCAQ